MSGRERCSSRMGSDRHSLWRDLRELEPQPQYVKKYWPLWSQMTDVKGLKEEAEEPCQGQSCPTCFCDEISLATWLAIDEAP